MWNGNVFHCKVLKRSLYSCPFNNLKAPVLSVWCSQLWGIFVCNRQLIKIHMKLETKSYLPQRVTCFICAKAGLYKVTKASGFLMMFVSHEITLNWSNVLNKKICTIKEWHDIRVLWIALPITPTPSPILCYERSITSTELLLLNDQSWLGLINISFEPLLVFTFVLFSGVGLLTECSK